MVTKYCIWVHKGRKRLENVYMRLCMNVRLTQSWKIIIIFLIVVNAWWWWWWEMEKCDSRKIVFSFDFNHNLKSDRINCTVSWVSWRCGEKEIIPPPSAHGIVHSEQNQRNLLSYYNKYKHENSLHSMNSSHVITVRNTLMLIIVPSWIRFLYLA